jgi:hypothetical protein
MADALSYGVQAASAKVREAGVHMDIDTIASRSDVIDAVTQAEALAQEFVRSKDASPGEALLFERYVTEAAVLGASIRASHQAPPMTPEEVNRVRDFFEFIFNGLFHR